MRRYERPRNLEGLVGEVGSALEVEVWRVAVAGPEEPSILSRKGSHAVGCWEELEERARQGKASQSAALGKWL